MVVVAVAGPVLSASASAQQATGQSAAYAPVAGLPAPLDSIFAAGHRSSSAVNSGPLIYQSERRTFGIAINNGGSLIDLRNLSRYGAPAEYPIHHVTVLCSTVLLLGSRSPSLGEASTEGNPQHGVVVNRLGAAVLSDRWSRG
jgi:hypothetical protein